VKTWQKDDGHLDAARASITGSGGRDLQIETTAAILGWLDDRPREFTPPVQKAVKWLASSAAVRRFRIDTVHDPRLRP
jgi:hypothetical protein